MNKEIKEKKLQLFFSQVTGEIYSLEEDEIETVDEYQIPLKQRPAGSCKKCHGRGYWGRRVQNGVLLLCLKCMNKCIDYDLLKTLTEKFGENHG